MKFRLEIGLYQKQKIMNPDSENSEFSSTRHENFLRADQESPGKVIPGSPVTQKNTCPDFLPYFFALSDSHF